MYRVTVEAQVWRLVYDFADEVLSNRIDAALYAFGPTIKPDQLVAIVFDSEREWSRAAQLAHDVERALGIPG